MIVTFQMSEVVMLIDTIVTDVIASQNSAYEARGAPLSFRWVIGPWALGSASGGRLWRSVFGMAGW